MQHFPKVDHEQLTDYQNLSSIALISYIDEPHPGNIRDKIAEVQKYLQVLTFVPCTSTPRYEKGKARNKSAR